jgi:hypothetical protein
MLFESHVRQRDPGEHCRGACEAGSRDNRTGDPPDDGAVGWALHETCSLCRTLGLVSVGEGWQDREYG